ncbi:hypothetical protein CEXT_680371, partial [Caerostris extrusa]
MIQALVLTFGPSPTISHDSSKKKNILRLAEDL